jgi:hypothetical protein
VQQQRGTLKRQSGARLPKVLKRGAAPPELTMPGKLSEHCLQR